MDEKVAMEEMKMAEKKRVLAVEEQRTAEKVVEKAANIVEEIGGMEFTLEHDVS